MNNELKNKIKDFKDGFMEGIEGKSTKWKIGVGVSLLVAVIIIFSNLGGGSNTPYDMTLGNVGPDGVKQETTKFKSGDVVMSIELSGKKNKTEISTSRIIFTITKPNGKVVDEIEVGADPISQLVDINYQDRDMKKGKYVMKAYSEEGKLYAEKKFKVKR